MTTYITVQLKLIHNPYRAHVDQIAQLTFWKLVLQKLMLSILFLQTLSSKLLEIQFTVSYGSNLF